MLINNQTIKIELIKKIIIKIKYSDKIEKKVI